MEKENNFSLSGNIVDVVGQRIFKGTLRVMKGKIVSVKEENVKEDYFIMPGFIDAHIHIESSMLIPSVFAGVALTHGTVAAVADPHEIANVLGMDGVNFMIANGKKSAFKFYFGAPSCVPATDFESSGAVIDADETEKLLKSDDIYFLSEMMNYPGVIHRDANVIKKLFAARKYKKKVDGHAPGLTGEMLKKYVHAGISTDHECFTKAEAMGKIELGMKILIREGIAARNFDELIGLTDDYSDCIMFCSDDKHPDDLMEGHINLLVKRAISKGYDPLKVLKAACLNPAEHYGLDVGLLQLGQSADFIVVDNLKDLVICKTFIKGNLLAENGKSYMPSYTETTLNNFHAEKISLEDIAVQDKKSKIKVIKAKDGQLITECILMKPEVKDGFIVSDIKQDIIKIVVMNRYRKSKPAVGFINGFNMKTGAIASTIAHDSHNIIATGANDADIVSAINYLVDTKGGISLVVDGEKMLLPLPFAGLMSGENANAVAEKYRLISQKTALTGTTLRSAFMTLSFMALLVIPDLKISDKGLFDVGKFDFTSLHCC